LLHPARVGGPAPLLDQARLEIVVQPNVNS
jgi:hypothetical protein